MQLPGKSKPVNEAVLRCTRVDLALSPSVSPEPAGCQVDNGAKLPTSSEFIAAEASRSVEVMSA